VVPDDGAVARWGSHPGFTVSAEVLDDWTVHFVALLAALSAELVRTGEGIALLGAATGSQVWIGWQVWTELSGSRWDGPPGRFSVSVGGGRGRPRVWQKASSPGQTAFGVTVTEWDRTVWLGAEDGPQWRLPAWPRAEFGDVGSNLAADLE
jgi:hypothetical protein